MATCLALAACNSAEQSSQTKLKTTVSEQINVVADTYKQRIDDCSTLSSMSSQDLFWSSCFDHDNSGQLAHSLSTILKNTSGNTLDFNAVDKSLYYLRAHYYFADLEKINEETKASIHKALVSLANHSKTLADNTQAYRLQEQLLALTYLYYADGKTKEGLASNIADFTPFWTKMLADLDNNERSAKDYRNIELYRLISFIAYYAVRDENLKSALLKNNIVSDSLTKQLAGLNSDSWLTQHNLWSLGMLHVLMEEDAQQALDKKVKGHLFSESFISASGKEKAKEMFSQIYLANSLRTTDDCNESFKGLCSIPTIDEVLPVNHECSDSIVIRANQMTEAQLNNSCAGLIAQESFFHSTLNTQREPIANDKNTQLRVVIFNNYTQYNMWGQLVFNIYTNNGGMYIEGAPEKEGNQATFYSFEAFWKQPKFSVWNLEHEYVHYLDGRFAKFGGFGHYPGKLVWWSEGIAEYVYRQNVNAKSVKLIHDTPVEEQPNLADIFATTYADGTERVYRWSYLAQRFIFTFYPQKGQALVQALKVNDFDSYTQKLDEIANSHQEEFARWMAELPKKESMVEADAVKVKQGRNLYRYLYRDYLRPAHLPLTKDHFHFENWG